MPYQITEGLIGHRRHGNASGAHARAFSHILHSPADRLESIYRAARAEMTGQGGQNPNFDMLLSLARDGIDPRAVSAIEYIGELATHHGRGPQGGRMLDTLILCAGQEATADKAKAALFQLARAVGAKILRTHGNPQRHDALVEVLAVNERRFSPSRRESHSLSLKAAFTGIQASLSFH